MRTWIIPLAVLLVVPALGAATPIVAPPERENLVEGHTVFTVIEQVTTTAVNHTEYAAAVAVLVREATAIVQNDRFPGVLWFNDQYLVDPIKSYNAQVNVRYPCTGAVLAVNAADPDPRLAPWPLGGMQGGYIESYLITDPNDRSWNVDKWTYTNGGGVTELIWTVAILDNQAGYNTPDDGSSNCGPVSELTVTAHLHEGPIYSNDSVSAHPVAQPVVSCRVTTTNNGCEDATNNSMGAVNGAGNTVAPGSNVVDPQSYETAVQNDGCTGDSQAGRANPGITQPYNQGEQNCYMDGYGHGAKYNAVLFFFLEDLTVAGADKDHNVPSSDVSGCQVETDPNAAFFTDHWPCPGGGGSFAAGNDNGEGNSHVFNPFQNAPVCPHCTGSGNHGGSGASGAELTHATRDVDIYYGIGDVPLVRQYRLVDTEGSLAPYYCQSINHHTGNPNNAVTGGQIGDAYNPDTDTVCTK